MADAAGYSGGCGPETDRPIGIFDSGVGGLTVVSEVTARMPRESIVYLGDTARVPYGTKSPDTVERYARACARLLLKEHVKLLVVACNTASAFALDMLRDELPVPVIGVIEPGARRAVQHTRSGVIGVIGTSGTIGSSVYTRTIGAYSGEAVVHTRACPLFVPLAEEGWLEGDVPAAVARHYLADMLRAGIDTLVLGCTHYPLLKNAIGAVTGPEVALVDSAEATAEAVSQTLDAMSLGAHRHTAGMRRYLVTDSPEGFAQLGRRFLGSGLDHIEWVDIA